MAESGIAGVTLAYDDDQEYLEFGITEEFQ